MYVGCPGDRPRLDKTRLGAWDCPGREKESLPYYQRNMVVVCSYMYMYSIHRALVKEGLML